ncbi:hypothetical protein [Morganella morganii]|nr:hypothetical protein [Morganella morganii]
MSGQLSDALIGLRIISRMLSSAGRRCEPVIIRRRAGRSSRPAYVLPE